MVLFGRQKLPTTRKFIQLNAVVVFAQTRLKACQRLLSIERRCVRSLRELLHGKRRIRQKKQRFKCAFSLRARSHDANTFLPYLHNVVCIIDYAGVRVPLALMITHKKRTACHVPPFAQQCACCVRVLELRKQKTGTKHIVPVIRVQLLCIHF